MNNLILFCILILFIQCSKKEYTIVGSTMGTTYTIKSTEDITNLQSSIDIKLENLENIFSTYRNDSEISIFNRVGSKYEFVYSNEFLEVLEKGIQIANESNGAFTVKLGSIINLWGFGAKKQNNIPNQIEINKYLTCIENTEIQIIREKRKINRITKKECENDYRLELDFSGIAKGYAVDQIAKHLRANQIYTYMIEIGGEVCVRSDLDSNKIWKLGIKNPMDTTKLLTIMEVQNGCIATSGNYYQSIELASKRLTHIINPRTGMPISKGKSSVTVYSRDNLTADSWATALFVLGETKGLELANGKGLAVLFINENETYYSKTWNEYFPNTISKSGLTAK